MQLREDEWQPRGAARLSLDAQTYYNRVAGEGRLVGPLVTLCAADDDEIATLRLASHLARELSNEADTFHAVARSAWLGDSLLRVAAAHNTIARSIDEHILSGNRARLDPRRVTWTRCIADGTPHQQLRRAVTGLDSATTLDVIPREETFVTPAQSELAVLLTIAVSDDDLAGRLERLIIGWRANGDPVFAPDVLPLAELVKLLPREVLQPLWINEPLTHGNSTAVASTPRFEVGGAHDWPFAGVSALRAAQWSGGAIAVVGGGVPGVRTWFDVFTPSCQLYPGSLIIRASVEAIRDWGAEQAGKDGTDEWMAGLNVLQGRITQLDRFSLPPLVVVEAARYEMSAAHGAAHVLDSYGLRAVAVERQDPQDAALPDVSSLTAMMREWIAMQTYPHPFVSPGRAVREQVNDIVGTVFGAAVDWSSPALAQLARLEKAGGSEVAVVVEADGPWDHWSGAHHLWGHDTPHALITHIEWRAAAGYVRALIRKVSS